MSQNMRGENSRGQERHTITEKAGLKSPWSKWEAQSVARFKEVEGKEKEEERGPGCQQSDRLQVGGERRLVAGAKREERDSAGVVGSCGLVAKKSCPQRSIPGVVLMELANLF
eukprot:5021-Pleurochrysis_carterae.AAC.1